jgi:hypothetical protein
MAAVPFRYLHHLVTVPVLVAETDARFVLDSGIGVTLISVSLADRVGWAPTGSNFSGRRMSGQEVTAPLGTISSLSVGNHRQEQVVVGMLDLGDAAELEDVQGFLSLDLFRSVPLTVDYPRGRIVLESAPSLAARARRGTPVRVLVELEEHVASVFLSLQLPAHGSISVEVDMGSDSLILNAPLARELGIDLCEESIRRVEGQDETGHAYIRYFSKLRGEVGPTATPAIRQVDPDVMFQEIIYDGLIGDAFLRNFVVTYDLASSRMIFGVPE